jgi:hypothetical protein
VLLGRGGFDGEVEQVRREGKSNARLGHDNNNNFDCPNKRILEHQVV